MAGDIFNGWPEDGEPVPRLSDRLRSRECECPAPKSNCRMHDDNEAADRLDRLEKALLDIINMKSCLLAEAKEIAKDALNEGGQ